MKFLKTAALAVALLAITEVPAWAQNNAAGTAAPGGAVARYGFSELRPLGVGLTIFGAAIGIGWLTKAAVESIARQPEMSGDIRTAMIISAALIEGVTFFALIILGFVLTI
jgi:F-type H+-transporting ATPase subunit c